jgi:glyoxylase-like metal-dependent hydrolase (beta-lactamase superfamily II)
VLCDTPDATVLIDPLLPPDGHRLLRALDDHVRRRERRVAVLTTIGFHRRSRDLLAERYGATTSRARKNLPGGVEAYPIRGAGETIFWLSEHRALVPGDRILGAPGGGLRLCPQSWLTYLPHRLTAAQLADALRSLLELPIERVLVSHGEPVLSGGHEALARALLG